jgi:two-component system osmolarity sensor histidine kinase EnvZ
MDTIARRFALTEFLAVAVAVGLVLLFNSLTGVWGLRPIERSGLLNEAEDMVRILEAAPPGIRTSLAAAASTKMFQVRWVAAGSRAAQSLAVTKGHAGDVARIVSTDTQRTAVTLENPTSLPAGLDLTRNEGTGLYMLAVRLADTSWLVFTTSGRLWGLSEWMRLLIRLVLLGVSIAVCAAVAARKFATPIKELAAAVREFGINPKAPSIPETGPRELRHVARTFNEMQAQIQKFVSYRTTMLAAISHDLRTPLTRMRLRGELIEDPDQQARLFRDVDEMQAMVDGALAFFRDDAIDEPTTSFNLPNVLQTIANDYADHGIEIPYRGPAHAVYLGRPFALKRAFTNLVENAIKYATAPEINLFCEESALVVSVCDRGPGIPDHALESVFLPYYRLDKSRNRNTGGAGLGLTVAQAIVQGHGGEIALTNLIGGGLQARVFLPLVTAR